MPRIRGIRQAFQRPDQPAHDDVDDEFAFHLEMRIRDLVAAGWRPDSARAEAMRLFGDIADARTYCTELSTRRERQTMRMEMLDALRQDLTFAMRSLRRAPAFAVAAIVTLALGVGANLTMFGIVDRLLSRPPAHVAAPELLRRPYLNVRGDADDGPIARVSYPQYLSLDEQMRPTASVAAFYSAEMLLGEPGAVHRGLVTVATASFLPLLGVRPEIGRFFGPDEDTPPVGVRVAVIGHALWTREYGGNRDVLGRTLTISGQQFRIIGVTPRGFTGLESQRIEAWVPISTLAGEIIGKYAKKSWNEAPNVGWLRSIVRLKSEQAAPDAERRATASFHEMYVRRFGAARADSLHPTATLAPLLLERGPERTPVSRIALWLAGMSLLVLIIASANVANLLLARGLGRRREIAVRMALGAGRTRLIAQLLTEGMLLALIGGGAALVVAYFGGQLLRDILIPEMEWGGGLLDGRTIALAAMVVIGTGMLIGLGPAIQASDLSLVGSLKTGARDGGGRRSLARAGLVVVQAALSLVLLVGAGLFLRSLKNARSVELGFAADHVLSVNLDMAGAGYSTTETMQLYDRLYERMKSVPGVASASLAYTEPFSTTIDYEVTIPGRDSTPMPPSGPPRINAMTPDFFATMETHLTAGRGFTAEDRRGMPLVAIVNETMARTLWPGRTPLGDRVCIPGLDGNPCFQIVGIAQDARWLSLSDDPTMQMYFPLDQNPSPIPLRVLLLRTNGDPTPIIRAVRSEVRTLAPRVVFADVDPLTANLAAQMRPWRLGATIFTLFGVLALVLAGLGLYSVIAYDVVQRTREIAVRMALGARAADVLRIILAQGVRLAALGVVAGIIIASAAAGWIAPLLFATRARDPLVLGAVAVTLLGVAVAACIVPALRATRVPPGAALSGE